MISSGFQKPILDEREYEQFRLENGILVTTISDKRSEKSSCSLAVRIGASSDNLPGLAHITEHAVFLGSEKYPVENEYKKYLNKNGGGSNGGTSMEQTVYKFYVNAQGFEKAVDIFSQFFKCPLLSAEAISREINAVDSEDSKNRILENRRLLQVLKSQVFKSIDYSKFSTGNLKTLAFADVEKYGPSLAQHIQRFHSSYYRPDSMAVCLVGPQSLEELNALAREKFSTIPSFSNETASSASSESTVSKNGTVQEHSSIFKLSKLVEPADNPTVSGPMVFRVKPTRELRDMSIIWEFPYSSDKYKTNPCYLLSYILNYKGEGSFFAWLQDKNYATALSSSVRSSFKPVFTLYEVSISLTKEGLDNYSKIWTMLQAYLEKILQEIKTSSAVLGDNSELKSIWEDMKIIRKMSFLFEESSSAYETSPMVAENMLDFPLEEVLSAGYYLEELKVPEFLSYLESMVITPSHPARYNRVSPVIVLRSKDFQHLPDDNPGKLEELMKIFESSVAEKNSTITPELLEKWKIEGTYFRELLRWLEERDIQRTSTEMKETQNFSFVDYEPFYGVPYEIEFPKVNSEENLSSELDRFSLPPRNAFISSELLNYTREELKKGLKSLPSISLGNVIEVETNIQPSSSSSVVASTTSMDRQSDPPKVIAKVSPDGSLISVTDLDDLSSKESAMEKTNVLWFSRDQIFGTPKSTVFFLFRSPFCDDIHPMNGLITTIFDQMTVRKFFDSSLAGLKYGLSIGQRGLSLKFVGYSNKLPDLGKLVTSHVLDVKGFWSTMNPQLFEDCKEKKLRALQSWFKDRPDSQAQSILSFFLFERSLLPADKIELLKGSQHSDVSRRLEQILTSVSSHVAYIHSGHMGEGQALDFYRSTVASFRAQKNDQSDGNEGEEEFERLRQLPSGKHSVLALGPFNKEDENNAYLLYIQMDRRTERMLAKLLLLRKMLSEPAFNILRTQKQLGYIVSLYSGDYGRGLNAIGGIELKVLSKRFSPLQMEKEVEEFFRSQYQSFFLPADPSAHHFTEKDLAALKQSIITTLKDPMNSLAEEGYHYYGQIINETPFDWKQRIIRELHHGDITIDELRQFYEEFVYSPSSSFVDRKKSLAIMIFNDSNAKEISKNSEPRSFLGLPVEQMGSLEEFKAFRSSLSLYEKYQP